MWCNVSLLRFCSQTFNLHHENSDWNCLKMQPGPQWVEASPAPGGSLCYLKSLTQLKRSSLNIFLWFSCTSCINPPPSTDDQGHSSHFIPQSSRHVLISTDNLYWSKNTIDVPPQVLSTETEQSYWLTFKREKKRVKKSCDYQGQAWHNKQKGKSPLFLCCQVPGGWLSRLSGIQQWPDDILSIVASLDSVCLFCVYTENRAS